MKIFVNVLSGLAVLTMLAGCGPDSAMGPPVSTVAQVTVPARPYTGQGKEFCYFWGHQPDVSGDSDRAGGLIRFNNGQAESYLQANGWDAEKHPVAARSAMTERMLRVAGTESLGVKDVVTGMTGNTVHFQAGVAVAEFHVVGRTKPFLVALSCGGDEATAAAGVPH